MKPNRIANPAMSGKRFKVHAMRLQNNIPDPQNKIRGRIGSFENDYMEAFFDAKGYLFVALIGLGTFPVGGPDSIIMRIDPIVWI